MFPVPYVSTSALCGMNFTRVLNLPNMAQYRVFLFIFLCLTLIKLSTDRNSFQTRNLSLRRMAWSILYFVERASRYVILVNDQLDAHFLNVFISCLYIFRATSAHHQEEQLVSIYHLVERTLVDECLTCRLGTHPPECVIPDDVLTQFGPPDNEHLLLETCRGVK
jgi:hypothetical protein